MLRPSVGYLPVGILMAWPHFLRDDQLAVKRIAIHGALLQALVATAMTMATTTC